MIKIFKTKLTPEKWFWVLAIVIVYVSAFLFLDVFKVPSNNRFDPSPISIGWIYVKLDCMATDTDFITEDSAIECKTSLISKSPEFVYADVIIQILNSEDASKAIWGCRSSFSSVNNKSYTQLLCGNEFYDDVFKPEKAGDYKFKIIRLEAYRNLDRKGSGIEYNGEDGGIFYERNMIVMSKNEAYNLLMSDRNYKIALMALLLFVPTLVLEIRRFLKE